MTTLMLYTDAIQQALVVPVPQYPVSQMKSEFPVQFGHLSGGFVRLHFLSAGSSPDRPLEDVFQCRAKAFGW